MKPESADRLTFAFHRLQSRLGADGRFVPIEDLAGISGALFRIYWKAWDADSAAVCSGDPLRRSAHAYGLAVAADDPYGERGFEELEDPGPMTLADRIELFKVSVDEGTRLAREGEYFAGRSYASGAAAYRALVTDLADVRRDRAPGEVWLSLRALFESIRIARRMAALYLNHLANFLDVAPAIGPFRRESRALGEAARIASSVAGDEPDDRSIVIPVLEAEAAYGEAIDALAAAREPAS